MAKCADCGKRINLMVEHAAFMDYVRQNDPTEDRFVIFDPEPFGVPLCCECAIETYENYDDEYVYGEDGPEDPADNYWPDD